jgi:hypothetical protein
MAMIRKGHVREDGGRDMAAQATLIIASSNLSDTNTGNAGA